LAFHPYPQLIRVVFNPHRFGPPPGVTPASPWPWIDRFGFGSASTHSAPCSDSLSLRLRSSRTLTSHVKSNSPDHNAKGTQSHMAPSEDGPRAPTACMHTVSGSVSLAVRRSFHLSLTVLFTIGHRFVFSLGGWSPQIQTGFLVSRPTRVPNQIRTRVSHTGLSPPPVRHSRRVPLRFPDPYVRSLNPGSPLGLPVWALPLSLAATQGISFDFSSSGYLDVSVPRVGSSPKGGDWVLPSRVSPFGYLRIQACLRLPEAFRSLPRPSSPICA
jgi:hypothetical protein